MQRVDLLAALPLTLVANLMASDSGKAKASPREGLFDDLAPDIADNAAQEGSDPAQSLVRALELFRMGVALVLDQGELATRASGLGRRNL